jgi:hypothetical protein
MVKLMFEIPTALRAGSPTVRKDVKAPNHALPDGRATTPSFKSEMISEVLTNCEEVVLSRADSSN